MSKVSVSEVKEVKTLQVIVVEEGAGGASHTVTFRFNKADASDAEVTSDGVSWDNVNILHKAIGAFLDRYPPEFSE